MTLQLSPHEYSAINRISKDVRDSRTKSKTAISWETMSMKLLLVHSEISEAVEEHRRNNVPSDRFVEEIADAMMRLMVIADYLNDMGFDFGQALWDKATKNTARAYELEGKRY